MSAAPTQDNRWRRKVLPLMLFLIRFVGVAVIRAIYKIQVVHPERIPATGGVLLLPNHVTFADGFFISASCPRPVRFVMDEAFTASRAIRRFVGIFDTVTIRRDQPREAIRITIDALKRGHVVCLFPEGQLTRTGTLSELRRGFELIARKAGHPLIPVWCDGAWGSIFSFERGRFFRKLPYRVPYGMAVAFGEEIAPENADLEIVRNGLLVASAAAIAKRFDGARWCARIPAGDPRAVEKFRATPTATRRQIWINGHQIGQVNGLQRRHPFHILKADFDQLDLPGLLLTFPELCGVTVKIFEAFDAREPRVWVGGEHLRKLLETTPPRGNTTFYDFSQIATLPLEGPKLLHLPCLAAAGRVIAMSMPHPPSASASEPQAGHKLGTWGKLLPGWYLENSRIHGPAGPDEGIELPAGSVLDAEGFLVP